MDLILTPKDRPSFRSKVKEWLDIVQSVSTIGAILAAGWWFLAQRNLKPQIKLEQTITQRPLAGKPGKYLVAIDVRATNIGKVNVSLPPGKLLLTQINPVPGTDLDTLPLKDMDLDPGEGDQAAFTTVVVNESIRTIQATSTYSVPGKEDYDWQLLSLADIGDSKPQTTSTTSPK
jgi:hypothetical protein